MELAYAQFLDGVDEPKDLLAKLEQKVGKVHSHLSCSG